MKTFTKILIVSISEILFLTIFLMIPIFSDLSWWWFFIPFIFTIISDIIIGIVIAIIKFSKKKKPEQLKINIKGAKKRAIYEMKYDDDNPDNFKIEQEKVIHIGEKGGEKTPILLLEGKGTELNQTRVVIVNLNNAKQKQTKLTDPLPEDIKEHIRLIADNPPEEDTIKETMSRDAFGNPVIIRETKKPSTAESIKKEEEKAEKENAF